MKNPWLIAGLLVVVAIGGSIWYAKSAEQKNNAGIEVATYSKGNPDAAVVLTEYSDFQCPACASFQPILKDVLDEFGASVRFEFKHFPLPIHPYAELAARAAEAAGQQDAFFAYHDVLFENQSTWSRSGNPTASFIQYAKDLNLDVELFKRHLNSSVLRDYVRTEGRAARELGLTGTPTFFLNGERMQIETYEDFYNQIAVAVNPEAAAAAALGTTSPSVGAPVKFGI